MTSYKHTQIGYLMLVVNIAVVALFVWILSMAAAEPVSVDSGTNLFVTLIMALVVGILASVSTLTVSIDDKYLRVRFGYGIFRKKFALDDLVSAKHVKTHWYYGWGVRLWMWPKMWIFNVSGFDAIEITTKSGQVYCIGTDDPVALERAIQEATKV